MRKIDNYMLHATSFEFLLTLIHLDKYYWLLAEPIKLAIVLSCGQLLLFTELSISPDILRWPHLTEFTQYPIYQTEAKAIAYVSLFSKLLILTKVSITT